MTSGILFLIAGCIGFCAAMAIIALRFRKLSREQFEGQLPRNGAHKARIGNGRVRITHHRSASK